MMRNSRRTSSSWTVPAAPAGKPGRSARRVRTAEPTKPTESTDRVEPTAYTDPAERLLNWFARRGWTPFDFQRQVWAGYAQGRSGLIHAATGTGKTLAAWLGPVLEGLSEPADRRSPMLRVLWVTPMRALASDTVRSLAEPVAELGLSWTVQSRTGDTSSSVRARQRERLPTALVTTPESLCLLLSRPEWPEFFADLRVVVVDEWHELLASKRGTLTELALARLRARVPRLRTWGLSATLGNLDVALSALLGCTAPSPADPDRAPMLVRGLVPKSLVVETLTPDRPERFPWAGHLRSPLLPTVVERLSAVKSALLFCNTRSQAELWYQLLLEQRPDWAGRLALHHGSLDRQVRSYVEQALRDGRLRCVVCTSSLDLGVDFSPVEAVFQIGSPKGVARLLQRAGRSGHRPGAESRVICVPTNTLELIDLAAAGDAVRAGHIEGRAPLEKPLDVLAQHVVTVAAGGGFRRGELLAEVRSAWSYRTLTESEWDWVLDFAVRGGSSLRGYPEFHRVRVDTAPTAVGETAPAAAGDPLYRIRDERTAAAHRAAIGTITADTAITVAFLRGHKLGTVEESFIARLRPGDAFVFAGRVLELVHIREATALVRASRSPEGAVPSWQGSRMPLSSELADAVRARLEAARRGEFAGPEMQAVRPTLELQARWSALPALDELLLEQLTSREGHHLFVYPFEGRCVHEGLAALLAYRLSRRQPISFTIAANDYGFELLSTEPPTLAVAELSGLLSTDRLAEDIAEGVNLGELSRRQFREVARIAGLINVGPPGGTSRERKSAKQLQASASLFYDTFREYDPDNLLLAQARREVLEAQLERSRLNAVLTRLGACRPILRELKRPTPLSFPLMVDRLRDRLSSEKLADRVRRMQVALERAAER